MLKVAFICHFSNAQVRARLPLAGLHLKNALKSILRRQIKNDYIDFAPWVSNLVREFSTFPELELHVIAPHRGLKKMSFEFSLDGVRYYFFKPDWPLLHRSFHFSARPRFSKNRFLIKRFLGKIKPDLVNLIGAENPYYAMAALDLGDKPLFVSLQTVYSNPERRLHSDSCLELNWETELAIHRRARYFGCGGRLHYDLLLANNPEAVVFRMFFPFEKPRPDENPAKSFDFVFFAQSVSMKKGIEEALAALALVKKEKPDVTLNVIGNCQGPYRERLLDIVNQAELGDNVVFNDYFQEQADMHRQARRARFALLPYKLDVISSAVKEAILLGLPVVSCRTSGMPWLNRDGPAVLLSEIGDVPGLAANMSKLLAEPGLAAELACRARAFVEKEFDGPILASRLLECFRAVLNHYHHDEPIPRELLFNPSDFPEYQR